MLEIYKYMPPDSLQRERTIINNQLHPSIPDPRLSTHHTYPTNTYHHTFNMKFSIATIVVLANGIAAMPWATKSHAVTVNDDIT